MGRAGRQGASTDHSCVMVNVPNGKTSDKLGCASTSAHWYARGCKSLGMPVSTKDGSIRAHPDTGLVYPGKVLPGASRAAKLCEEAHQAMMPGYRTCLPRESSPGRFQSGETLRGSAPGYDARIPDLSTQGKFSRALPERRNSARKRTRL